MNVTIELLALDRNAWGQLAEAPAVFAAEHALTLGAEPDLLRAVGQQTVALLERTGATTPWTGYLAVDRSREIIIGTCAFTALPDNSQLVDINGDGLDDFITGGAPGFSPMVFIQKVNGKFFCFRLQQGRWVQASAIQFPTMATCEEACCRG